LPSSRILPNLPGPARERHRLRVRGADDFGGLQTRLLVVYADGGDGQKIFLGSPWPNPSTDKIRIMLDIPLSGNGQLSILDLRGRRLVDRSFPPGSHLFVWDGRDGRGRRAASGTYFIRLEGSGPVTTRKVVLLR